MIDDPLEVAEMHRHGFRGIAGRDRAGGNRGRLAVGRRRAVFDFVFRFVAVGVDQGSDVG